MKNVTAVITATAMLAWAGVAHAFTDGNELLAALSDPSSSRNVGAMLFIKGAANALSEGYMMGGLLANPKMEPKEAMERVGYCIPAKATVGQLSDVVKLYLTKHPELRHLRANGLIQRALGEAFPCDN